MLLGHEVFSEYKILDVMHHDVTIDRVLKNIFKCSEGLGFVLCIRGVQRFFVL